MDSKATESSRMRHDALFQTLASLIAEAASPINGSVPSLGRHPNYNFLMKRSDRHGSKGRLCAPITEKPFLYFFTGKKWPHSIFQRSLVFIASMTLDPPETNAAECCGPLEPLICERWDIYGTDGVVERFYFHGMDHDGNLCRLVAPSAAASVGARTTRDGLHALTPLELRTMFMDTVTPLILRGGTENPREPVPISGCRSLSLSEGATPGSPSCEGGAGNQQLQVVYESCFVDMVSRGANLNGWPHPHFAIQGWFHWPSACLYRVPTVTSYVEIMLSNRCSRRAFHLGVALLDTFLGTWSEATATTTSELAAAYPRSVQLVGEEVGIRLAIASSMRVASKMHDVYGLSTPRLMLSLCPEGGVPASVLDEFEQLFLCVLTFRVNLVTTNDIVETLLELSFSHTSSRSGVREKEWDVIYLASYLTDTLVSSSAATTASPVVLGAEVVRYAALVVSDEDACLRTGRALTRLQSHLHPDEVCRCRDIIVDVHRLALNRPHDSVLAKWYSTATKGKFRMEAYLPLKQQ